MHQFRQAYELDGTELGQFGESPEDRALRRKVQELDRIALGEATPALRDLAATSPDGSSATTGLDGRGLSCRRRRSSTTAARRYGDFVLSVNRLDRAKRIDLLIEAAALDPALASSSSSDGPDRERLERLARERGLDGRVRFTGRVEAERLADLYARCLAVVLRAGRRGLRDGPVRGLPLREAGDHDDRRGRAARRRPRPRDRARRRPRAQVRSPRAAAWLRDHVDQAAAFGRAGKGARRRGDLGSRDRQAAVVSRKRGQSFGWTGPRP